MWTFIHQAMLLVKGNGTKEVDTLRQSESTGTSSSTESSKRKKRKKKKTKHSTPPREESPQVGGARPRISSPSPKRHAMHDCREADSRPSRPRQRVEHAKEPSNKMGGYPIR